MNSESILTKTIREVGAVSRTLLMGQLTAHPRLLGGEVGRELAARFIRTLFQPNTEH